MHDQHPPVAAVFLAVAVVVVLSRLFARGFRHIGQPAVIGEMIAGIVLGTSLLGQLHVGDRSMTDVLFPTDVRPFLTVLANLGLVFFMFIVGMELDLRLVRGNERLAVSVSLCSVLLPFVLGALLGLHLFDKHTVAATGTPVDRLSFVLFLGASMSVTAFPVLARILGDRGLSRTPLGILALGSAAVDDVIAWSLLAVVVAVAGSAPGAGVESDVPPPEQVVLLSALYILVMATLVRRLLRRIVPASERAGGLTPDVMAVLIVGLLVSAWVTDRIGIHFVFGAFVFGACLPRRGTERLVQQVLERLEQLSVLVLLPVFFIVTGLSVDLTSFERSTTGELLLVLLVAIASKFVGATLAAVAGGVPRRRACALGLLMNTRGLTELVLLNIGLRMGVLDTQMFSMLVVMALVTTFMTTPLLNLVYPDRILAREKADAERLLLGSSNAYRVLVVLDDDMARARAQLDVAIDALGGWQPAEILLARFREQESPRTLEVGSGRPADLLSISTMLEEMHVLEQVAAARGVRTISLTRHSADAKLDVAQQADAHGVDLVLMDDHGSIGVDELLPLVGVTVVARDGSPEQDSRSVACLVTTERGAEAALAVAARLARARSCPLMLVPAGVGRRSGESQLESAAQRLSRAGIPTSRGSIDTIPAGTLVMPRSTPAQRWVAPGRQLLRVTGSSQRVDSELTRFLRQPMASDR